MESASRVQIMALAVCIHFTLMPLGNTGIYLFSSPAIYILSMVTILPLPSILSLPFIYCFSRVDAALGKASDQSE